MEWSRFAHIVPGPGEFSQENLSWEPRYPEGEVAFMMEEQEQEQIPAADWTLVYIAKKLKEAQALEQLLEEAGLGYDVQPDTYRGGIIFVTERIGAFFYVHPEDVEKAHELLIRNRYKPYKVG